MTDERLPSKGNIRFRYHPVGSFENPAWPTAAEMNAGQELEAVTLWESFEVGAQASETSDTASIKAKTNIARRGAANYGGSASFWYPGDHTDFGNLATLVLEIMKEVNRPGYLSVSVDGEIGEPGQPAADFSYAAGDLVTVMAVITDEWEDSITGEEAFYYTRNFLKNGFMRTYTVVSAAQPLLTVSGGDTVSSAEPLSAITALVNGRDWTRGARYTSSDVDVVTVSPSGMVRRVGAGTATINVVLPNSSVSTTVEVTAS